MLKIGILCAADGELEPFISHINNCTESQIAKLKVYEGDINGLKIAALYSGVCKVNAAIATQILIDQYDIKLVINSGVAGGMRDDIDILDTVISAETIYHDVAEGTLTGYHPRMESEYFKTDRCLIQIAAAAVSDLPIKDKIKFGRIVTGEAFITNENRDIIVKTFNPLAVDMESAAIAHVCYANEIPFLSVRTITDNSAHDGGAHFELNFSAAARQSCEVTLSILDKLYENKGLF
jgi:5''-methylthioadenosine/S-adenosylhomocysteine nucleosidase